MIRPLAALLLLLCAWVVPATVEGSAGPAERFADANRLYEQEKYTEALEAYEDLLSGGYANTQVLANAGNAAYLAGDRGRAVLYYVRALRHDPRNEVARHNLSLIQPRTNVVADDDLSQTFRIWLLAVPTWVWVVVLETAFLGGIALLLLGVWRSQSRSQFGEWVVRAGGLWLIAALAAGGGAFALAGEHEERVAVVISEGAVTRVGPGERFMEQLSLPAGTLVELPDVPAEGWVRYRLRDGRTGYVRTDALEPV